MELKYGKQYSLADLRTLFNIGAEKNGTDTIKYLSRQYKINKVKRGTYIIERELDFIEKIEAQIYYKNRAYIEPMIYAMLGSKKTNSITMDMHQLMREVEIVNKDFHYIKYHTKECSLLMNQVSAYGLDIFIKEAEPMLKKIIRDVLKDMEDRQLIKVNMIPILAFRKYDVDLKQPYVTYKHITKAADIQKLLEIKHKILTEEFKVERESEVGYYDQTRFKDLIAKEYEADFFYYKYNIVLNTKDIVRCSNTDENLQDLKKSFNHYIQDKVKKSKQGDLKCLKKEEKDIYIKYCVNTDVDFRLRDKGGGDKN